MRAIDADTLRERLQSLAYDDWNQGIATSFADACNEIIEIVEEQPTIEPSAQPERKKGKWIRRDIKGIPYCCSVCSGRFDYEWKFCPNCGADMRGEQDEQIR